MIVLTPQRWFYSGSCFGPIIIIRAKDYNPGILNHEYTHYKQQREMLYVFAYLLYIIEFFVKLLYYRNFETAYRSVSFEREAIAMQDVIGYANNRKPFQHLKLIYIDNKKLTDKLLKTLDEKIKADARKNSPRR